MCSVVDVITVQYTLIIKDINDWIEVGNRKKVFLHLINKKKKINFYL